MERLDSIAATHLIIITEGCELAFLCVARAHHRKLVQQQEITRGHSKAALSKKRSQSLAALPRFESTGNRKVHLYQSKNYNYLATGFWGFGVLGLLQILNFYLLLDYLIWRV